MPIEANQGLPTLHMVESDADVGAGSPGALTGFPAQTVGYSLPGTDPYGQYPVGTLLFARNSAGSGSRLYWVTTNGSGTKVAALIATGSVSPGGGGSIVGTPLLYVLSPLALGLTNSFTDFDTAIASIPNTAAAMLMILPGTYSSTGVTMRGSLSVFGMTSPLYPDKDSGGTTFGGVIINQGGTSITIDSGALSVGSVYSFSNIQLNASGVNIAHAGAQPLQFDNVSASGTTFINKTGASGIKVGFVESYIACATVFTEPTSGGFRTSSIKARDSILGVSDPGATPTTGILGILCNDVTATNCDLCGMDVVRSTEITGGRIFIEDGTNPCIYFRGQVPDTLSLTNVVLRTSTLAVTYVGGVGGTVDLNGATFQRVSTVQTSLVSPVFPYVRSNNAPGGRIESFSSSDTASPTTSFVSIVSSMTLTIPEPLGIAEDQRLTVYNRSSLGSSTIDAAGAGTIAGAATLSIGFGQYVQLTADRINNNWLIIGGSSAFIGPITTARPDTLYVVGNLTPVGTPYNLSSVQYTTIGAAVTAASTAGGGTVQILPGSYAESFSLPNQVNLVGVSEQPTLVNIFGTITVPNAATTGISGVNLSALKMNGTSAIRIDNSVVGVVTHGVTTGNTDLLARSTSFTTIILDNATSGHNLRLEEGSSSSAIVSIGFVALQQSTCSGHISTGTDSSSVVLLRDAEIDIGVTTASLSAYNSVCGALLQDGTASTTLDAYGSTFTTITISPDSIGEASLYGCLIQGAATLTLTGLRANGCNFLSNLLSDGTVLLTGCTIAAALEYGDSSRIDATTAGTTTGTGSAIISASRFSGVFTTDSSTEFQACTFANNLNMAAGFLTHCNVSGTTIIDGGARIVGGDYIGQVTINEGFTLYIDTARLLSLDVRGVLYAVNTEFVNGVSASSTDDSHSLSFTNCVMGGAVGVSATAVSFSMRDCVGTQFASLTINSVEVELYSTRFENSVTLDTSSLVCEGCAVQGSFVLTFGGSNLQIRTSQFEGAVGIVTDCPVVLQDTNFYDATSIASTSVVVRTTTCTNTVTYTLGGGNATIYNGSFGGSVNFAGTPAMVRLTDCDFSGYTTVNGTNAILRNCIFEDGGNFPITNALNSSGCSYYGTIATMAATQLTTSDDLFAGVSSFTVDDATYTNSTFENKHTVTANNDITLNLSSFVVSASFAFDSMSAVESKFLAQPTFSGATATLFCCTSADAINAGLLGDLILRDTIVFAGGFPVSNAAATTVSGLADASNGNYSGVLSPEYSARTAKNVDSVMAPGGVTFGNYLVKVTGSAPGDALVLPAANSTHVWGYEIFIFNVGSTSVAVTPQVGDVINGAATPITLLPQRGATFFMDPNIGWLSTG